MKKLIHPAIFGKDIKAFFTGKNPGAEIDAISEVASVPKENIYMPLQKHTDKILVLDSDFEPKIADAVITNEKGIMIGVQVADCVPLLLCDMKRHIIGAVHAGWRGTAEGILKKAIKALTERFHSAPSDIVVAVGPSIRWCCYEVGYDVIESVKKATGDGDYFMTKGGKYCLDLQSANKHQAISIGILEKNIWLSEECTYCLPDQYYSYRYAKGPTGRQGGFIGIV